MGYVVTSLVAHVTVSNGSALGIVPVHQGGAVPDNITDESRDHLLAIGMIAEGEQESGVIPTPLREDTVQAPAPSMDEVPAGNASLDAWRDYARTQGATDEELGDDGLGRDALRDKFGPK